MNPGDLAAFSELVDDLTAIIIVLVSVTGAAWLIVQIMKHRAGRTMAPSETAILEQISRVAERMDARMSAVERVLDSDAPAWRDPDAAGTPTPRRFG